MPIRSQSIASSFTSAMFTERKTFSSSFVSSAASGVETGDDGVADRGVEVAGALEALGRVSADDLRGRAHGVVGAPRVDALGRERHVEVAAGGQPRLLQERHEALAGGAGIGRGLEHHELAALQHARHAGGGAEQRAQVGLAVAGQRRGHADDHGVAARQLRVARGREQPVADLGERLVGDVLHVALAALEPRDLRDVRVHAHHRMTRLAERDGQWQADVPHTDDANLHESKVGPLPGYRTRRTASSGG